MKRRSGLPLPAFCALVAAGCILGRYLLIDFAYFKLLHIPSHDMSQGFAFFATSMHSLRLTGDLAWWYPGSYTGYAQYFQALVGPLAPTYGNVVFIAWAHVVAILGSLGIAIPEYLQYLTVNFIVFPFLAFFAFTWFCSLFLRHRAAVLLAVIAYAFSGIGAWNSAWFYFQEPFTAFFLLAAAISLLQRPTVSRMLVLLAAILIQFASLNYWTVYNIFMVPIFLGAYVYFHPNQPVRLWVRIRTIWRRQRLGAIAALAACGAVILAWTIVLAASLVDQSGNNVREVYSVELAVSRIAELRRFTTELFNPSLERVLSQYPMLNDMHSARYLGIALVPLIAIGLLAASGRRARWLLASTVLILFVCLGSPFLAIAWTKIPMMDRIQHLFYFYTQYWQLGLVLIAALGFDVLLREPQGRTRALAMWILGISVAACAGTMAATLAFTQHYAVGDANLQSILRACLVLGLSAALLFRGLWLGLAKERRFTSVAFLLIVFVDLTLYFHAAGRADMNFTPTITSWPKSSPESLEKIRSAWPAPRPEAAFASGFEDAMPFRNMIWPMNTFMLPRGLERKVAGPLALNARASPPLAFYDGAVRIPWDAPIPESLAGNASAIDSELVVGDPAASARSQGVSRRVTQGFAYEFKTLRYNDFAFEVTAPTDGWLMVRQLHDPGWKVTVDGADARPTKANYVAMALPLKAGRHELRWEFRPLPRALYWPAAAILELALAFLLVLAWRTRRPGYAAYA